MNLVLLSPGERCIPLSDDRARHIKKVLRAKTGDTLLAGEIDGPMGHATISNWNDDGIHLDFTADSDPVYPAPVDVVLGHPRPIVLRRMIRDLCSIGVRKLLVVPTELGEKSYLRSTMWRDVQTPLLEGASQAGTTRLMHAERCDSLRSALQSLPSDSGSRIVLHPASATVSRLLTHRAVSDGPGPPLTLAIGSERGWTPGEIVLLSDAGFAAFDLGPRTLRTESAGLVAAWIAVQAIRPKVEA